MVFPKITLKWLDKIMPNEDGLTKWWDRVMPEKTTSIILVASSIGVALAFPVVWILRMLK